MVKLSDHEYQTLIKWKERYELALMAANDGIWDWNMLTNEVYMSPRFKEMLGYQDAEMESAFSSWEENLHPDDSEAAHKAIDDYLKNISKEYIVEFRMRHKNSHYVHILSRGRVIRNEAGEPARFIGTHTDISSRKQAEHRLKEKNVDLEDANSKLQEAQKMLLQQEKMASIGQLAAGVAHEINNPIGFIQSNVRSLKQYLEDIFALIDIYEKAEPKLSCSETAKQISDLKEELDLSFLKSDIGELIDESQDGLKRIIKIVHDLKDFSYMGEEEWESADIVKGLETTLNIAHNELKYKAEIIKQYETIPNIECIPSQLNQVFLNLLVNAAHAIEEKGKVIISTGVIDQNRIFIEISDSGHGIPKEKIGKIFDPFFTTKDVGKGTGLGLSLAYGIIEKHHGKILVSSELSVGTTFRIELPIEVNQGGES